MLHSYESPFNRRRFWFHEKNTDAPYTSRSLSQPPALSTPCPNVRLDAQQLKRHCIHKGQANLKVPFVRGATPTDAGKPITGGHS